MPRINRLSRRYVLLKISGAVLRREIERFRRENQDPVVKIASRYFRRLTLESFFALAVDEDERGRPALGGMRQGKWVGVATLKALAGFAKKIQVILFTHHKQIVGAAAKIGMDNIIKVHRLVPASRFSTAKPAWLDQIFSSHPRT